MGGRRGRATYKIGEAAGLLGVKTSVLRFWEGEFSEIDPIRTESGQRLYSEEHMALLRRIKTLLYDEKLTIDGAKRRLRGEETPPPSSLLAEIRRELLEIRKLLS